MSYFIISKRILITQLSSRKIIDMQTTYNHSRTEAKYLGDALFADSLWKFWDIPLFASDKIRKRVTYRISVHTQCKGYEWYLEKRGSRKISALIMKFRNLGLAKN